MSATLRRIVPTVDLRKNIEGIGIDDGGVHVRRSQGDDFLHDMVHSGSRADPRANEQQVVRRKGVEDGVRGRLCHGPAAVVEG